MFFLRLGVDVYLLVYALCYIKKFKDISVLCVT